VTDKSIEIVQYFCHSFFHQHQHESRTTVSIHRVSLDVVSILGPILKHIDPNNIHKNEMK
jgi:hypothetical protein